jgi:glutamate 5-kinase
VNASAAQSQLDEFRRASRVVIKIGSALFVDPTSGTLDRPWLTALCDDIAALERDGKEVVVVSSGAVALGRRELGFDARRSQLEDSQAAAAAGQILLAHAYQELLGRHGIKIAQVLLTLDDSESRPRYLNASRTLLRLLRARAIPVVNENDTVATQELRYGDNDRLAGRVAQMISADCLILLSDVDGLYTADPQTHPDAEHVAEVREIDAAVMAMAGGPGSRHGSGGMRTKLEAARIALGAGCRLAITSGRVARPVSALLGGARATWFVPGATPATARKQWIAGTLRPKGSLTIDAGAQSALDSGRSLLPAGVVGVEGQFERGDAVRILGVDGAEIGRGLVTYSATESRAIAGCRSSRIEEILGYRSRDEIIHRDDLVLKTNGRPK